MKVDTYLQECKRGIHTHHTPEDFSLSSSSSSSPSSSFFKRIGIPPGERGEKDKERGMLKQRRKMTKALFACRAVFPLPP